jgi:hypothetical protein
MILNAAELAAILARSTPVLDDGDDWSALSGNTPALLAYIATTSRDRGYADEADAVEQIVRAVPFRPDQCRRFAKELRAMGFVRVADRLAQIAGRRRDTLKPPVSTFKK